MRRTIMSYCVLPVMTALVVMGLVWGCQRVEQPTIAEAEVQLSAHQVMQVWNEGNMELLPTLFASDVTVYGHAGAAETMTVDQLQKTIENNRIAFPDLQVTIDEWFTKGDKILYHWIATGINTGPLEGVPATGKEVKCTGITMVRIADGKAVEMSEFFNELDLLKQLGFTLIPPEPQS